MIRDTSSSGKRDVSLCRYNNNDGMVILVEQAYQIYSYIYHRNGKKYKLIIEIL